MKENNMISDFVLFIIWIVTGTVVIIGGVIDKEKKTAVINYIVLWIVFILEMISKMTLTGGLSLGK